jgi:hypothetical protein
MTTYECRWNLTLSRLTCIFDVVTGMREHLERPAEIEGIEVIVEGKEYLDDWHIFAIAVFRDCTHLVGIVYIGRINMRGVMLFCARKQGNKRSSWSFVSLQRQVSCGKEKGHALIIDSPAFGDPRVLC